MPAETRQSTSELRYDALSGRTVIVATGRGARPHQFRAPEGAPDAGTERCPFCPGHEAMTPPEVARTGIGAPGTPGWRVRVVPNLYPIVDTHEVVVLSPDHYRPFDKLDDDAAIEVLTVLRDRVATHVAGGHAAAVAILNHKREAGASLPHPHAQVLATDSVPPEIAAAVERTRSATTDLVLADAGYDERLVVATGDVTAWCPYASSASFQLRVAHTRAGARFHDASHDEIAAVALALRDVLRRLSGTLDDPAYNVVVHSAPAQGATDVGNASFHWYVEVLPRVAVIAGFELATGLFVNAVAPEQAAAILRGEPR